MRQHVVGEDHIGAFAFGLEPGREVAAEELDQRRHAGADRRRCWRLGRVDALHRDAALDEVAQQVAIVARDLDDQRLRAQPLALDQLERVGARVREQRAGDRGEIRILAVEQNLRAHGLGDLHQGAGAAKADRERRLHVWRRKLGLGQQAVGERRLAERQDGREVGGAAGAALGLGAVDLHRALGASPQSAASSSAQRRSSASRPSARSLRKNAIRL